MSSAALSSKLTKLLKKTSHHDKDERFMAISDLCTELESPDLPPLDPPLQSSLSRHLLPLLVDPSVDVQTISVKALGLLTRRLTPDHTRDALDRLTSLTLDPSLDSTRDVYVIGLRTIIAHIGQSPAHAELGGRTLLLLITGLSTHPSPDVTQAALDLCQALLSHMGAALPAPALEGLLGEVLGRVEGGEAVVQKRVIGVLGALTPLLNERLFNHTMDALVTGLKGGGGGDGVEGGAGKGGGIYVYLQAISTISSTAGSRISRYLSDIIHQLARVCSLPSPSDSGTPAPTDGDEGDEGGDEEQQREVRMEVYEAVLSAFEALISRCSHDISPHLPTIVPIALTMARYDPNWAGGDDPLLPDALMTDTPDPSGWDDDDVPASPMADDNDSDDGSWKVRRAALRALQAVVAHKADVFASTFFPAAFDLLLERLTERDENVQLAVLDCIAAAVRESVVSQREDG